MTSQYEWVKTPTGSQLLRKDRAEANAPSRVNVQVSKGVAHVAHSLPTGFDEKGQPLIKGAGSYLNDGTPVIHSQRDIDAIQRNHPEYRHGANKHRLNLDK